MGAQTAGGSGRRFSPAFSALRSLRGRCSPPDCLQGLGTPGTWSQEAVGGATCLQPRKRTAAPSPRGPRPSSRASPAQGPSSLLTGMARRGLLNSGAGEGLA